VTQLKLRLCIAEHDGQRLPLLGRDFSALLHGLQRIEAIRQGLRQPVKGRVRGAACLEPLLQQLIIRQLAISGDTDGRVAFQHGHQLAGQIKLTEGARHVAAAALKSEGGSSAILEPDKQPIEADARRLGQPCQHTAADGVGVHAAAVTGDHAHAHIQQRRQIAVDRKTMAIAEPLEGVVDHLPEMGAARHSLRRRR